MNRSRTQTLALGFLLISPVLMANKPTGPPPVTPRKPQGIYAVVNVDEYLNTDPSTNFPTLYQALLSNSAVSGIALYENWSRLNPSAGTYDWSLMDDAFSAAVAWNGKNSTKPPKTIQLVVSAGFNSPVWLVGPLSSCNFLFDGGTAPAGPKCGKATFSGFVEGGNPGGTPTPMDLPLPWDPTYKSAWQAFLTQLAERYEPYSEFVSIAVAGPTASSEEMMLPAKQNTNPKAVQVGGLQPNDMWIDLLNYFFGDPSDPAYNPAYLGTDQAFIDEWTAAIDMFGTTFGGITLVATTGNGLPDLTTCTITTKRTCTFTIPSTTGSSPTDFTTDCPVANMDCAAEASILSYFEDPSHGGSNAKATQTDGMKGAGIGIFGAGDKLNMGVAGVKLVSGSTEFTSPSSQVRGGSQFAMSFAKFPVQQGCTSKYPSGSSASSGTGADDPVSGVPAVCFAPGYGPKSFPSGTPFKDVPLTDFISPEQSALNVLKVFFEGTAVAATFGGTVGTAPLNYLQIYGPDIQTAEKNIPGWIFDLTGAYDPGVTVQYVLNLTSEELSKIAE